MQVKATSKNIGVDDSGVDSGIAMALLSAVATGDDHGVLQYHRAARGPAAAIICSHCCSFDSDEFIVRGCTELLVQEVCAPSQ